MTSTTEELAFVEELALLFEQQAGVPRMAGRILGWLLICEPPEQSASDLARVLQASKGSISAATRLLIGFKLIDRVSLPGRRRDYFRIRPGAWIERMRQGLAGFGAIRRLLEQGLALLDDEPPERRARLADVHALYAWMERELPALFERWEQQRREATNDSSDPDRGAHEGLRAPSRSLRSHSNDRAG